MAKNDLWVIDFETKSITDYPRPHSPPPCGLAVKPPGKDPMYLAWGHPIDNGVFVMKGGRLKKRDATADPKKMAGEMLADAFKARVLGHNIAKFDIPVAQDHFHLTPPTWDRVDDTLFSLFLYDPHAPNLRLKESSERLLGIPPTERNKVFEWLAQHSIIAKRIQKGVATYGTAKDPAGAHISEAPGSLVAEYAIGDLTRPIKLHEMLMKHLKDESMVEAYDRERELAPILLDNERSGVRVDVDLLAKDCPTYRKAFEAADAWIRKRLKAPGLNVGSDADVAEMLRRAKVVTKFPKTPTGKDSVSKKRLTIDYFNDPHVYHALAYRNTLEMVLLRMEGWLKTADEHGKIYKEWSQVRQGHDDKEKGARSGRITVSELANMPKAFGSKDPTYKHPAFMRVPEPPLARMYVLPDKNDLFGHSDFDQQEMKLTAHFEDGRLAEAYRKDPKMDAHVWVHDQIVEVCNVDYNRDIVKIVDFRTSYGGGVAGLAEMLRIPYDEAKEIIGNWKRGMPDVVQLDRTLRDMYKAGEGIRTLGGRIYRCKPPAVAKKGPRKGQMIQFFYTALNYLIQPSAADQTKQAIIDYYNHPKRTGRLLCTVYDEINISMENKEELAVLQECMVNAFKLDVPVTTTLKVGPRWGKLEKITLERKAA